jgi:nitroreductase
VGFVKEILDIPEEMVVINLLPIGVPDQSPEPRGRKPFEDLFFENRYGKALKI